MELGVWKLENFRFNDTSFCGVEATNLFHV